ncbi:MAG: phasin family protein [Acidisphaera sp.]|nr:phasin family protein [Acidisphaera sp.]
MANTETKKHQETHERGQSEHRNGASRLRAATEQTAEQAREIGQRSADAVAETTDAMVDVTRHAASRSQEAMRLGLRAVAGAHRPLTEATYNQSQRMLQASARVSDLYREAAESAADDVQALIASYSQLGRGMQQLQHACFDLMHRSVERTSSKQQDLLRAGSPVEFAEIQRDLYLDTVDGLFEASTTLLQLAGRIAQEAVRPLQDRGRAHA